MNPMVMKAVAAVFAASIILVIPFVIMNTRKKKLALAFRREALAAGKCMLNIYGGKVTLNDKSMDFYESQSNGEGGRSVKLDPGAYRTLGTYGFTSTTGKKNFQAKDIALSFSLEAGLEYDLGVYQYELEWADVVACAELEQKSFSGKSYIACLKSAANNIRASAGN